MIWTLHLPPALHDRPDLRVGDILLTFQDSHRVYQRDDRGRAVCGPIWREHWRPTPITGETRVSWQLGAFGRVPKARFGAGRPAFLLPEELDGAALAHDLDISLHRREAPLCAVTDRLRRRLDGAGVAALRQAAAALEARP